MAKCSRLTDKYFYKKKSKRKFRNRLTILNQIRLQITLIFIVVNTVVFKVSFIFIWKVILQSLWKKNYAINKKNRNLIKIIMMVRESLENSSPLEVQNRSLNSRILSASFLRHQVLIASQSRCFRYGGKCRQHLRIHWYLRMP